MSGQATTELILTNIHQDDLINRIADAVISRLQSVSIKQSSDQQDRKLTRDQAKELLNISNSTLRNWEHQDILKPIRMGRRVYYLYSDLVKAGNKIKSA